MITLRSLHTITCALKGVQLDQFLSLIEGDDDPDSYALDAISQIQNTLASLHAVGILDEDEYQEVMLHAHHMKEMMR